MLDAFADPRLQPLRLASGLVMFTFALLHFTNHAVGLIGLDAMNRVQDVRLHLTHSAPVRMLLLAAIVTHLTLGIGKLAARRTLHMPPLDALQIASGLLVPALLIPHAVAMAYFSTRTDFYYSYTSAAYLLWPGQALWQSALLLVVWLHGSIGIDYWLRPRAWYRRLRPWLLAAAITLPVLALTGFLAAAREVRVLLPTPAAVAEARAELHWPTPEVTAAMLNVRDATWAVYGGLLALGLLMLAWRRLAMRAGPMVVVAYDGGPNVKSPVGPSLLEISRHNGIPHTSVCGGRARCSTCRVRVDDGVDSLPPPAPGELATLERIKASPNVRLACQLRPTQDIGVTRLVTPSAAAKARVRPEAHGADGVEKQVAILFLDVRGFTRLSQDRLPFDVVFLLNQFFTSVGAAIRSEGGWIDKYLGDGLMAVFGHRSTVAAGCRDALAAARAIDLALDAVNERLRVEVAEGIRIGIGIHAGPVVIGRIGDGGNAPLTVIGSTVNVASRLEELTKEKRCQLVISRSVATLAGLAAGNDAPETVTIRGAGEGIEILTFAAARDLPTAAPSERLDRPSAG